MVTHTSPVPGTATPVRVEGVRKRFRQGSAFVDALKSVDLSIDRGDFVAIMGASGSGKSTLMHVCAGLTPVDEGRVMIDGSELGSLSDAQLTRFRRRRIGVVFQSFNLIPSLTAEQNIALPLLTEGRKDLIDQRMGPLLDRLGLESRRRHRPDALSGGEQQRVAIGRALITDPALVLADEPTGSLDSVTGQSICRLLRDLCEEHQRTIVVVTHEASVAAWAKRVVIMKDGSALADFPLDRFGDANSLAIRYQEIVNSATLEVGGVR